LLAVTELIARYSHSIQARLANPVTGVPGKCKFLPTIAEIVEMAENWQAEEARMDRYAALSGRRIAVGNHTATPADHCPFPRLVEAFSETPELWRRQPYAVLQHAAQLLATIGRAEAETYLRSLL
jgi:hypothetical protein